MEMEVLERQFSRMGARVRQVAPRRWSPAFGIDVRHDAQGEFFALEVPGEATLELSAVDVRPDMRHLLLLVRRDGDKEKYLCGHDERHWFVAGVENRAVASVEDAMRALRPNVVDWAIARAEHGRNGARLRHKNELRRRNRAFLRQGEWFFVPQPDLVVDEKLILHREPISRGNGSKPHICEWVFRRGGLPVYVCTRRPRGVTTAQYFRLIEEKPEAKSWGWRLMQRDAEVYARGRVWHPDHKTITLPLWHRVLMNSEHARGVVFLD